MSKISRDKKKAEAEGKLKGKKALTATAKKTKKEAPVEEQPKSSIPNFSRCCTCKFYAKFPEGVGHMCKKTKKPTPRKSTCNKYDCKA